MSPIRFLKKGRREKQSDFLKFPLVLDVSHWEVIPDWERVSPRPALVFCKATEGVFWQDHTFPMNWQGLSRLHIRRGAYHFWRFENPGVTQADHFLNAVFSNGYSEKDYLVLDFGRMDYHDDKGKWARVPRGSRFAEGVKTFLDRVEEKTGQKPIIYTSRPCWEYLCDTAGLPPAWTADYLLWVAWYPPNPSLLSAPPASRIPSGWNEWAIWQYSEAGRVEGIPHDGVDLNITSPDFARASGIELPPQPTASEPVDADQTA
jgi:lysozyme